MKNIMILNLRKLLDSFKIIVYKNIWRIFHVLNTHYQGQVLEFYCQPYNYRKIYCCIIYDTTGVKGCEYQTIVFAWLSLPLQTFWSRTQY